MKKIFLIFVATSLIFAGCNSDKTSTTSDDKKMGDDKMSSGSTQEEKEERNKKTAMASIEAFSAHDVDKTLKDISPDAVDYFDGSTPATKGMDSIKAQIKNYQDAFPNVKGEDFKYVADGDWVMVWGQWTGTWKNDFMGQKATGKSYKVQDVDIFKFNDEGKITEHHNIQPWSSIASQVGMKMH
jgi:predicted ester cyclase